MNAEKFFFFLPLLSSVMDVIISALTVPFLLHEEEVVMER
mgnify:CR=1 FL=1